VPPTPTGTVTVEEGTLFTALIQGSDADSNDVLTINSTELPTGAAVTPALPSSAPTTVSAELSWTPTAADVGSHPLQFSITDGTGRQALCSFTLDVVPRPPMVCDVDDSGTVDTIDIQAVLAARGQTATGADDPRDANGDGVITITDSRACVLHCTKPRCAS
jgi:hypothetical protein